LSSNVEKNSSYLNARTTTETRTRVRDTSCTSGMCPLCIRECPFLCEISLATFRGREALYPQPLQFGESTASGHKDFGLDWSHINIFSGLLGTEGIEADSDYLQIWSYDFASSYIDITASGDIHIQPSSDTSDYIVFNTTANTPKISTIGDSDLIIDSSSNNVKLDSNVDITDDLNVTGDVFIGLNITGPYTANLVDGGPSEFQVNIKDRLRVYGEVIVDDLNTGGNAGTDLCFDIVGALCECGHCAGEGP